MRTKKEIEAYHQNIEGIPKDYMDRLAYIYQESKFNKSDVDYLLERIDQLHNTEWESVKYIFYMEPKSTPRPRVGKFGVFYVKNAKDNKNLFDEFMEAHSNMEVVISTPCRFICKAYIKTPSNMSVREKMAAELELIHCVAKPDWDNIAKTYCDMIQKTLIVEDSIVIRGEVEKYYSVLPRIEIELQYMKAYDCKYNKRKIESWKAFKENELTLPDIEYII